MTGIAAARPAVSTVQQCWVLTARVIRPTLRNGELGTQVAAPVMFTVDFYLPLKGIMGAFAQGTSSYGQYLMPLVALVAVAFAGISAALRAATDSVQGIDRRFKAMPIAALTPLAARMLASMYRCCIALAVSLACGYAIGFRFYGGVAHTAGFCVLVMVVGAAMALLGDVIGVANQNPAATAPLLLPPLLVLGLLSVGLQPVERFPAWIRGFVRDQLVSQFINALRALAGDRTPAAGMVTWPVMMPTLIWLAGFIVILVPLHVVVSSSRR
ncbi:ABC transporter permease [Candidatus Mycobacterium methanotrophicum]|uniref:ABC transporter permease n=1 Tax=Candidatus Mycobacterium methanotrophicum TaxID=2943498 RepID=A0ABY4QJ25_9MYCO|nr:ABC transporter permease [Candidatus Mycobacterium methanotrophicum]UQX09685.1 ABC transporter permease [Candidatus Mycobacterium methanotrophicum]